MTTNTREFLDMLRVKDNLELTDPGALTRDETPDMILPHTWEWTKLRMIHDGSTRWTIKLRTRSKGTPTG